MIGAALSNQALHALSSFGLGYITYVISKQEKGLVKLIGKLLAIGIVFFTVFYSLVKMMEKFAG